MSDKLAGLLPTIQKVFWDVVEFVVQLVSPVVATIREVALQTVSYISNIAGKIVNVIVIIAPEVLHIGFIIAVWITLTVAVMILMILPSMLYMACGQEQRRASVLPLHREHTTPLNHRQTTPAPRAVNWVSERRKVQVEIPSPTPRAPPVPQVKAHPSQKRSYGATYKDPSTTPPLQRYATAANRASTDLARPKTAGQSSEEIYAPDVNETDARYASLRARAIAAKDAMESAFDERRVARGAGNRARMKALSNLAKAKQAEMERLNDEASRLIFRLNNTDSDPSEVDLHGLYVKEAVRYASQSIEEARRRGDSQIRLIVGKGLHSPDGVAKLRPAIQQLIKKRSLVAASDPGNAGVLIVQL